MLKNSHIPNSLIFKDIRNVLFWLHSFEIAALVYFGVLRQISVMNSAIAHNVANCRTYASPAPKANDDLVRATFYTDCAKVKNGLALGVKVHAIVRLFSVFR